MSIFGYFDNPSQESPTYDPGLAVLCPHCMRTLTVPMMTISLMRDGSRLSYFYRVHKHCHLNARSEDIQRFESSLIDASKETNRE